MPSLTAVDFSRALILISVYTEDHLLKIKCAQAETMSGCSFPSKYQTCFLSISLIPVGGTKGLLDQSVRLFKLFLLVSLVKKKVQTIDKWICFHFLSNSSKQNFTT